MLFALVVAEWATQASVLLELVTNQWSTIPNPFQELANRPTPSLVILACFSQAFLSLYLVSMSWVIWSRSNAAGHNQAIDKLFSWPFALLLLEVLLVTLYFALANNIESELEKAGAVNRYAACNAVSSRPEALIVVLVFVVYILWDLIADVLSKDPNERTNGLRTDHLDWSNARNLLSRAFVYCLASVICFLLSLLVFWHSDDSMSPHTALAGDIALIAIVIAFRPLKELEPLASSLFSDFVPRSESRRRLPLSFEAKAKLTCATGLCIAAIAAFVVVSKQTCFQ